MDDEANPKDASKKMGRPQVDINWKQLNKLCFMQCTLSEIADWFECSNDTIERRIKKEFGMTFAAYFKKRSARGKMALRRAQFQSAVFKKNVTMQIWLGKQYLGQKEPETGTPDDLADGFEFVSDETQT